MQTLYIIGLGYKINIYYQMHSNVLCSHDHVCHQLSTMYILNTIYRAYITFRQGAIAILLMSLLNQTLQHGLSFNDADDI